MYGTVGGGEGRTTGAVICVLCVLCLGRTNEQIDIRSMGGSVFYDDDSLSQSSLSPLSPGTHPSLWDAGDEIRFGGRIEGALIAAPNTGLRDNKRAQV